ncbi:hypothetical protein WJX73_002174 [Symbiochloris irregularis]|uniref:Rab-GAP TBC domain-containing protein n=1 Tax=Symbiochloris irregularis TaxID=706552 RepID=A0AAW1PEB9_9CHLO
MGRQTRTRDSYGFEVKHEYVALYKQYAPLWEKEESERVVLWNGYLEQFCPEGQSFDQEAALSRLEEHLAADPPPEDSGDVPAWRHQLRSLVQAGIPMAFKGRLWKAFLGVQQKKKAGLYKKLLSQALPKQTKAESSGHSGSRLGRSALAAEASSSADAVSKSPVPGVEPSASGQQVQPQPPTVDAVQSIESGGPGSLEAHLPPATLQTVRPSAGTGPVADQAGAQQVDVPAGEAMNLNSAVNRALLQAPVHAERDRAASARAARPASAGAGSQTSQGAQDWQQQIEKDLHRTFPGHPVMDKTGRSALRRILLAYSLHNPDVGYCQGMNFVAGALLLFMAEEDAFWCLAIIAEDLLPGYFALIMVAPQVDQLVFKQLVDVQFPTLAVHLEAHMVNVASVSTQWFLCLFVNSLPLETCLRVWDMLFWERCASVLFRIALTLVDIYSLALLSTVDSIDCLSILQSMAPMSYDSSRLIDTACIGFAHINQAHLASLRAVHQAAVQAQFQKREEHSPQTPAQASSTQPQGPSPAAEESTLRAVAAALPSDHRPPVPRPLDGSPLPAVLAEEKGGGSAPGSPRSHSSLDSMGSVDLGGGDYHSTPRWKGTSVFSDQTLQHLSRLSSPGLSSRGVSGDLDKKADAGLAASDPQPAATESAAISALIAGKGRSSAAATAFRIASVPTAMLESATAPGQPAPAAASAPAGDPPSQGQAEDAPSTVLPAGRTHSASLPPLSPRETRRNSSGKSRKSSDGPSQDTDQAQRPPAQPGSTAEGDAMAVATAEDRLGLGMERSISGSELRLMQPRAKVMAVAEGLEEELFVAEAYRHDAEVQAEALAVAAEELQVKLGGAQVAMQERQAKLAALQARLAEEGVTLEASSAQVQDLSGQLRTARSQLALKLSLVAEKDALIAALMQQTGQAPSSFGQGLLRFARFGRQGKAPTTAAQKSPHGLPAAKTGASQSDA